MKAISTQKEILVITGSTFAQKKWCKIDYSGGEDHYAKQQMLEEACRKGILPELLPEILREMGTDENLYIWFVRYGHAFIQLELCEQPLIIEREFSLDPYLFLSAQIFN